MDKKVELRECPFCGSEDVTIHRGPFVGVRDSIIRLAQCNDCGAQGPYSPAPYVVALWNSRADDNE